MAKIINGKIIRTCKKCSITNDVVKFRKQKDTRSGRVYENNLCMPCYDERRSYLRRKYYRKHREEQIAVAAQWNKDNKERYNKRRRNKSWLFNNCIDNFYLMENL